MQTLADRQLNASTLFLLPSLLPLLDASLTRRSMQNQRVSLCLRYDKRQLLKNWILTRSMKKSLELQTMTGFQTRKRMRYSESHYYKKTKFNFSLRNMRMRKEESGETRGNCEKWGQKPPLRLLLPQNFLCTISFYTNQIISSLKKFESIPPQTRNPGRWVKIGIEETSRTIEWSKPCGERRQG